MTETLFRPRPLRQASPGADFVQPGLTAYRDEFGAVRGYKAELPDQVLLPNTGAANDVPVIRPVNTPIGGAASKARRGSDGNDLYDPISD